MIRDRLYLLGLFLVPTSVASAHPGHGTAGGSHELVHYLSDPVHLAGFATLATAAIIGTLLWRRLRLRPDAESC